MKTPALIMNVFLLLIRRFYPFLFAIPLFLSVACDDDKDYSRSEFLIVSESTEQIPTPNVYCKIEGGEDTLYVFSNVEYKYFFQTDDKDDKWVKILKSDYLPELKATRLIIEIEPRGDNLEKRTGTLSFSSKENFFGQFIPFNQGFSHRLNENFSWLKYGTNSPFDISKETLIKNWTNAQIEYGWKSTIENGYNNAFCYGKNGYIKLGTDILGADLITPYISTIVKDTVLLLTFDAVAFTSENGIKDNNKLTVNILDGGVFPDGSTSKKIDLGYYDHTDKNITSSMWNNAEHKLFIMSDKEKPLTGSTRVQFVTGTDIVSGQNNRLFIDNINLFIVDWRSHYLIEKQY